MCDGTFNSQCVTDAGTGSVSPDTNKDLSSRDVNEHSTCVVSA